MDPLGWTVRIGAHRFMFHMTRVDRVCDRACRPVYPLVYCVCIERVSQWRISNRVSHHVSDAYLVSCIARCVLLSVWRVYWPTY